MRTCTFCGDPLEPDSGECVTCALAWDTAAQCRPPRHSYLGMADTCTCGQTTRPPREDS